MIQCLKIVTKYFLIHIKLFIYSVDRKSFLLGIVKSHLVLSMDRQLWWDSNIHKIKQISKSTMECTCNFWKYYYLPK